MSVLYEEYSRERKLHWLTIIYNGIVRSPGPLLALYFAVRQQDYQEIAIFAVAIFFGIIAFPAIFLRYYYFRYYITEKDIVIRSGVISKNQRYIPIERVQNIEINQNFIQRIFGIVKVQIETAGGAESEGLLEYVSKSDSEDIKNVVRDYQYRIFRKKDKVEEVSETEESQLLTEDVSENEENEISPRPEYREEVLFRLSKRDLVYYGMMRMRPLMVVFMAWLFSMAQQFYVLPDFSEMHPDEYINEIISLDSSMVTIYIIVGIIIILFSSWLADIIVTVFQYWDFRLKRDGDKLISEYGLFNRRTSTIPLRKLQMLVIRTNPLRRYFGFYGLSLETAGFGVKEKRPEVAIPSAKKERVIKLSRDIRSYEYPEAFIPVSKKTIRRAFIRYCMIYLPPIIIGSFFQSWLAWGLLIIPFLLLAAWVRWKYRGYYVNDSNVLIRQGFLIQRVTVVQIERIQTLNIYESFFQRRLRLATLNIDTAATGVLADASIIDIDRDEAEDIFKMLNEAFKKAAGSQID